MPAKLPPKCAHCGAREPLDDGGMCLDYQACIARKPLAGTYPMKGAQPKAARVPQEPLEGPGGTPGPPGAERG
jgi:hypothetical protein